MNDKQAKRLRNQARTASVGLRERRLIEYRQTISPKHGGGVTGAAMNDPRTTRGIYRQLKKGVA